MFQCVNNKSDVFDSLSQYFKQTSYPFWSHWHMSRTKLIFTFVQSIDLQ